MDDDILFKESQKFKQWWVWLILLGVNLLFLYGIYVQLFLGRLFGSTAISDVGLIFVFLLTVALTILFAIFRLDTVIKKDGVYYRFLPFQRQYIYHPFDSMLKCYVRKYSSIKEFGGWGWRIGLFGQGIAFTIEGSKGLQLKFKDKKRLLIGTNKPEELTKVIKELEQFKK